MNRLVGTLAIGILTLAVACGGDDDDDNGADAAVDLGNPGFILPPAGELPQAYKEVGGVWELQGDANFGCLNTATDDVVNTAEYTLTGETHDFQTDDVVDNVKIEVVEQGQPLDSTPIASTTSDAEGKYSITIPTGVTRLAFKSSDPEDPTRFFDTYLLNQYFNDEAPNASEDLNSVSFLTGDALPAFIGVMRTEGLGILAGAFRDCDNNEVDGVIATVNTDSCAAGGCDPTDLNHLQGAQTYYFSAGSTSLPVRLSQAANTNHDGLFVVIELPPSANSYLQVWGYKDQADADSQTLSLLGEIPSPVLGDSVITGSMEPYRTGQ